MRIIKKISNKWINLPWDGGRLPGHPWVSDLSLANIHYSLTIPLRMVTNVCSNSNPTPTNHFRDILFTDWHDGHRTIRTQQRKCTHTHTHIATRTHARTRSGTRVINVNQDNDIITLPLYLKGKANGRACPPLATPVNQWLSLSFCLDEP